MLIRILILISACLSLSVEGQMGSMNPALFFGKWYEISYIINFDLSGLSNTTDVSISFTPTGRGNVDTILTAWNLLKQEWVIMRAIGTFPDPGMPTKFRVTFPDDASNNGDYFIIGLDADVAVILAEANERIPRNVTWILAREKNATAAALNRAFGILESRGFQRSEFESVPHGVAVEPDQVRIPTQPNFSLKRFGGLWYEMFRTTNTPDLTRNSTDVRNLIMVNRNGTLKVNFTSYLPAERTWIGGTVMGYTPDVNEPGRIAYDVGDFELQQRILMTDYDRMAVIYSDPMTKIGRILSRTQNLPSYLVDEAFRRFEQVGLQRKDFEKIDHGNVSEFEPNRFIPEAIQRNFSLQAYAGLWYILYRTPDALFKGTTDHTEFYSTNGNSSMRYALKAWLPTHRKWLKFSGTGRAPKSEELARMFYSVDGFGYFSLEERVKYTDYSSISVVYSHPDNKIGWIMARRTDLPNQLIDMAFDLMQTVGLDREDFERVIHGVAL